ncbi:helix-hairpin-helix domain-containing protein [Streptomyces sp. NPDC051636]|uniref:helix-hairpin-helix domain-containing protein n=1 Tax=Streptomyces sp. NPDC051636 TaxID=3365663 RepID=UPI0037B887DB
MALRSRSRTATATSGPGRAPASDGRIRHRRPPTRRPARHRHAPAEELRRRAELLFAENARQPSESGHGPPPAQPRADTASGVGAAPGMGLGPGTATGPGTVVVPRVAAPATSTASSAGPEDVVEGGTDDESVVPDWRERATLALRERMPVWLQARCALERRGAVALTVLLAVAAVFAVQHFWAARTQSVSAPQAVRAEAPYEKEAEPGKSGGHRQTGLTGPGATAGTATASGTEIVVDVSGKVRDPGIHRLPAGSRVADALRAAGGVRPGTSTEGLNRARFLVDGEQVVVSGHAPAQGSAPGAVPGSVAAGTTAGAGPSAPVSLNTGTAEQFDTLPGVGPVLAQHIIDYRTRHGGFRSVDELRQVNGIGDRRFADLRNLVRP